MLNLGRKKNNPRGNRTPDLPDILALYTWCSTSENLNIRSNRRFSLNYRIILIYKALKGYTIGKRKGNNFCLLSFYVV